MSSSTCRSARRRQSATSIRDSRIPAELQTATARSRARRSARISISSFAKPIAAARFRRPPRSDLHRGFLRPLPPPARARPSRRRTISTSTASRTSSIPQRPPPFHGRARGAQRHPPDVSAAAGEPQSGADQPHLRPWPRSVALGHGPRRIRHAVGTARTPVVPANAGTHTPGRLFSRDAVRRLSRNNKRRWVTGPLGSRDKCNTC